MFVNSAAGLAENFLWSGAWLAFCPLAARFDGWHDGLGPWLAQGGGGTEIHRDAAYSVWLVPKAD